MNAQEFNKVLEEVFERVAGVLQAKAEEYADDTDRLRNFKLAAGLKEVTPIEALSGMMVKHTVSVYDYISLEDVPTLAEWDEKIIDHINYLILLRALVVEHHAKDS
jgi:DNA-binding Lrp family transcriptional regulator